MRAAVLVIAAVLSLAAATSHAQLKNENLLVAMPDGFKVGHSASRNGMDMQEWVPSGETVQDWTEMVTVQVFRNRPDIDPGRYQAEMSKLWARACPGAIVGPVVTGITNGYPSASLLLRCPLLASTGKPEVAAIKAIKGRDSFYVVQRAVRTEPAPAKLDQMKQYLDRVSVCDTRLADRPCKM